jgi:O-antigen/teichoic acid export membrane protein
MRDKIFGFLIKEDLFRHSTLMLIASIISFFFGYLFHFYMARALGPTEYGVLGALLGLLYILSVPTTTIDLLVTRYTSLYNSKGCKLGISALLHSFLKRLSIIAVLIFLIILVLSPWIADFLKLLSPLPILLLGLTIAFSFILPITRGILRGLQDFSQLALNTGLEKIVLLGIGITFIALGLGVNGAIFAYGLASIAIFLLSLIPLRSYLSKTREQTDKAVLPSQASWLYPHNLDIYKYTLLVFLTLLFITIIASIDVIAVKRFFSAEETGYFTATKMTGEVIYFASCSLAGVLFPKASEPHAKNEETKRQLKKALQYFSILATIAIITTALYPTEILSILFGTQYIAAKSLLLPYVLAMCVFSLSVIMMHYNLAISNFRYIIPLIFLTLLEICLIAIFHESINQVIYAVLVTSLALLFFTSYILKKSGGGHETFNHSSNL